MASKALLTHTTVTERHVFYDTAEECADAAASIFAAKGWKWALVGVPGRREILSTLRELEGWAKGPGGDDYSESGRLSYLNGRYGHERAG